jgi:hypothetical protein
MSRSVGTSARNACIARARGALSRLAAIDRRYETLLRPLQADRLDRPAAERRRAELEALRAFERRPHAALVRKAGLSLAGDGRPDASGGIG